MTHPITPPTELMQAWAAFVEKYGIADVFTTAAQWGADQELEACCEWFQVRINEGWNPCHLEDLRTTRRPKQPSLKEQAYIAVDRIERSGYPTDDLYTIRRALEALPND